MKQKTTATLLALFLGCFGAHFFYLGKTRKGIICLLFSWTLVPALIGLLDFALLLKMSDVEFCNRYAYSYSITIESPVNNLGNTLEDLERLYRLKEQGLLSEADFETKRNQMFQFV